LFNSDGFPEPPSNPADAIVRFFINLRFLIVARLFKPPCVDVVWPTVDAHDRAQRSTRLLTHTLTDIKRCRVYKRCTIAHNLLRFSTKRAQSDE
jgi:hypothetical protein